jgi:integrase
VKVGSERPWLGLGSYPEIPLAAALDAAREMKEKIRKGIDPRMERRLTLESRRLEQREISARLVTFKSAAEDYVKANEAAWTNAKHAQQWRNTLATYAYPSIGHLPVSTIAVADILDMLNSDRLWQEKTETASRLRQRVEKVLDAAKAKGQRQGDNPAAWGGNLDALLPKPSRVSKVKPHTALAFSQVPVFMSRLRASTGMASRMLELAVLCTNRSAEVRGAVWSEFDLDAGLWVIPAARMKADREHRIPLAAASIQLLRNLPRRGDLVFPSPTDKAFSDAAMSSVLKRLGVDVTQHGFRSSFRDWVAETTSYPGDMAELALAHKIANEVEAAYRRGDMLERRREMMEAWATFCLSDLTRQAASEESERETA